jgi:hypothetical protein
MFEQTNNAAWLCDFAFQFVALEYETFDVPPPKNRSRQAGIGCDADFTVLVVKANGNHVARSR